MSTEATDTQTQIVDLDERNWLPRHCRGDAAAFPALLSAYRRPVYGYLVRCGVAIHERDDLFQSVFLKIHAAAASYDPTRPLSPWLFAIVGNTVRNHFRDSSIAAVFDPDDPPDPPDPAPGPERIAESREMAAWLEGALQALPPMQRQVLLLATLSGMRQSEIAAALDIPLNTVKTHLRRARLALVAGLDGRDAGGSDA